MPIYVERADADYLTGQQIVEQLSTWLAGQYQAAETELLAEVARRVALDMNSDDPARRARAIAELRTYADRVLSSIDEDAAARVVATAVREGEAAALEQLGLANVPASATSPVMRNGTELPFASGLTSTNALAAAQIGFELTSNLSDVRSRILRTIPDVYRDTVARFASQRLLGVVTGRETRTRAAASFLAQGITGFRDKAGRSWTVGSYSEMATRTATNRAWIDAHANKWAAMGFQYVTIVRGADSCRACAAWSGKVLAMGGAPTGTVTLEHATTGEPVTLTVAGTIADARAAGWNHPNCRCTLAPVFPGLSLPADDTTYDPQAERDRERLRYLERRVRDFKRKADISGELGDDVAAQHYRRMVRFEQERIRAHVADTGQVRKPYREQLSYSGQGVAPKALPPVAVL